LASSILLVNTLSTACSSILYLLPAAPVQEDSENIVDDEEDFRGLFKSEVGVKHQLENPFDDMIDLTATKRVKPEFVDPVDSDNDVQPLVILGLVLTRRFVQLWVDSLGSLVHGLGRWASIHCLAHLQ